MRTYLLLAFPCLLLCGCATPAETTAAVVGGTTAVSAALTDLFGLLKPFLKPEDVAQIAQKLASAQNWAEGLTHVVGAVGEGLGQVRVVADAAAAEAAEGVTAGEVAAYSGGAAAGGTVISRIMSILKHGHAGKAKPEAA